MEKYYTTYTTTNSLGRWLQVDPDGREVKAKIGQIANRIIEKTGFSLREFLLIGKPVTIDVALGARDKAINTATSNFSREDGPNGNDNAFQHAYWMARTAQKVGKEQALEVCKAHEAKQNEHYAERAMDLNNYEIGATIGAENPNATPEELMAIILAKIANGELQRLNEDNQLVSTDSTGRKTNREEKEKKNNDK